MECPALVVAFVLLRIRIFGAKVGLRLVWLSHSSISFQADGHGFSRGASPSLGTSIVVDHRFLRIAMVNRPRQVKHTQLLG